MVEALQARPPRDDPFPSVSYDLPIDVVLALPTSSVIRQLIQERRNKGHWPLPMARVFASGHRYFAIVDFGGANSPGLLYPLDVYVWEKPG